MSTVQYTQPITTLRTRSNSLPGFVGQSHSEREGLYLGNAQSVCVPHRLSDMWVRFEEYECPLRIEINGNNNWIGWRILPDPPYLVQLFAHQAILLRHLPEETIKNDENGNIDPVPSFVLRGAYEFTPADADFLVSAATLVIDRDSDLPELVIPS